MVEHSQRRRLDHAAEELPSHSSFTAHCAAALEALIARAIDRKTTGSTPEDA